MNDQVTAPKKRGPKPREQSAAGLTTFETQRAGLSMADSRDPNEAVKAERIRIPLGTGQDQWLGGYKLDWDNFHYHMFHESQTRGGRVAEADMAFYEHCQLNGENIKRPSGAGWDYLMRIPQKYYQEDMARARKQRQAIESDMNTLKSKDGIQDYGIDKAGRPVFDGEAPVKHGVSENPYV